MRKKLALLLLVAGCHKGGSVASNGSATAPGSDMHAAVETVTSIASGGSASGSAVPIAQTGSSATNGTGAAAAAVPPPLAALNADISAAMKLDVHPRIVELAKDQPALATKAEALASAPPPGGVDATKWTDAVGQLKAAIDGISMCTQDLAKYDKRSEVEKNSADDQYEDCAKSLAERLHDVNALVPGAK